MRLFIYCFLLIINISCEKKIQKNFHYRYPAPKEINTVDTVDTVDTVNTVDTIITEDIEEVVQEEEVDINIDSDGDFITDLDELENGTNPFIANIPRVIPAMYQDVNLSISYKKNNKIYGLNLLELEGHYKADDYIRKKIIHNYYKKTEVKLSLSDFYSLSFPSWSHGNYYPFLHHLETIYNNSLTYERKAVFQTKFKIRLQNDLPIKKIDGLKISQSIVRQDDYELMTLNKARLSLFNDYIEEINYQDNYTYPFELKIQGKTSVTTDFMNDLRQNEMLVLQTQDFKLYYENGKEIFFHELVSDIKKKTIQIIISSPSRTEQFFITPEISIKEFLLNYDSNFILSDSNDLIHLGEWRNSTSNLLNNYLLTKKERKHGRWEILLGSLDLNTIGQTVLIAYITKGELEDLTSKTIFKNKLNIKSENKRSLGMVNDNSEIRLKVSGIKKQHRYGKFYRKNIVATWEERHCVGRFDRMKSCSGINKKGTAIVEMRDDLGAKTIKLNFKTDDILKKMHLYFNKTILPISNIKPEFIKTIVYEDGRILELVIDCSFLESGKEYPLNLLVKEEKLKKIKTGLIKVVSSKGLKKDNFKIDKKYKYSNWIDPTIKRELSISTWISNGLSF
jgi:hypothetical protein